MFDATESIEKGYLWNFSRSERQSFYHEHQQREKQLGYYNAKLHIMVAMNDPAIFSNDEPHPSSPLEIKYTLNRIYMNDPREKELLLNQNDPVSNKDNSFVKSVVWAFEDNTFCKKVVLNGVRFSFGWHKRGFNDDEATQILDALSDKKLTELTFTSYPLLTDKTYQKIANIITHPRNSWAHITLGRIPVSSDIADRYSKTEKVSFTRIEPPKIRPSFWMRLFHRGQFHERS